MGTCWQCWREHFPRSPDWRHHINHENALSEFTEVKNEMVSASSSALPTAVVGPGQDPKGSSHHPPAARSLRHATQQGLDTSFRVVQESRSNSAAVFLPPVCVCELPSLLLLTPLPGPCVYISNRLFNVKHRKQGLFATWGTNHR